MGDTAEIDKLSGWMEKTLGDRAQELREMLASVSEILIRRYFSSTIPVIQITSFVDSIIRSMEPANRFYLLEGEAVIRRTLGEDHVSLDRISWASMNVIRMTVSFRISRELGLERSEIAGLVNLAEREVESRGVQLTPLGLTR